ncbi:MAG: ATP-binding protein [Burkholderiales bacterium]|nr:MAG: ATP-binding protein [Burkholderiales bacterium]
MWRFPGDEKYSTRSFIQERLAQCSYDAISDRDTIVLRKRLIDLLVERTAQRGASRVVLIADEAQNLTNDDYRQLVHIFNAVQARGLRPFIVLVGQPELKNLTDQWTAMDSMQFIGRFCGCKHDFLGIELHDLAAVLEGFDEYGNAQGSAAFKVAPAAFAEGWRIAQLAPVMSEAVLAVCKAQNIQETVRLPMQYLRSCLLSMMYRIIQDGMRPIDWERDADDRQATAVNWAVEFGREGHVLYFRPGATTESVKRLIRRYQNVTLEAWPDFISVGGARNRWPRVIRSMIEGLAYRFEYPKPSTMEDGPGVTRV